MMDEVWSRGWSEAHKAALRARDDLAQAGQPMPTLWDEVRMLVRDLIRPAVKNERSETCCDAQGCQSAA